MNQQQRQQQPSQQPLENETTDTATTTPEEQSIRGDLDRLADLAQRFAIARQMINEKQMISITREDAQKVLTNNVQVGGE